MKRRAAYLIIIFLVPLSSLGQNLENNNSSIRSSETKVELERNITLENDSEAEEVIIEIKDRTQRLELLILSKVGNGKVTIELYDPNGTRQGSYTVGTLVNSEKEEMVNGKIRKSLFDPQAGKWKVKIIPINATGRIQINTAFAE